jgi:hypothetical protein
MGWWGSVGCDSLRDEMCMDVKILVNNVRERIVRGRNVWGHNVRVPIVPVPGYRIRLRDYKTILWCVTIEPFHSRKLEVLHVKVPFQSVL